MNLVELRDLCVVGFPLSTTRSQILEGVEFLCEELTNAEIRCEIWVNGSLLTEKIDPQDSDTVVCVEHTYLEQGTDEQKELLKYLLDKRDELKRDHLVDCYVHFEYPKGHDQETVSEWMRAYWIKQFGFSRGENLKGIARITTP